MIREIMERFVGEGEGAGAMNEESALKAAEDWLRENLRSRCYFSTDEILECVKRFRERVEHSRRTPQDVANEIIDDYFRLLDD